MLKPKDITNFQAKVLDRYQENKRDLPWRDSDNSYHVLVSEVMSQQTQISRVIPKYHKFLETLPQYEDLAHTDKPTLLTLRSGLGYNNRALRLQWAARVIHEEYWGILPEDEKSLITLPGIGKYTAHALLAFVYNQEVPVLDINIRRVICHSFNLNPELKDRELRNIAYSLIPPGQSKDWHNALMDYGALVLTSKITWIKSKPQSKFKGSRRRVSGSVLKKLVSLWAQDISALKKEFPHEEFDNIIEKMINDKLVHKDENKLVID